MTLSTIVLVSLIFIWMSFYVIFSFQVIGTILLLKDKTHFVQFFFASSIFQ